MVREGNGVRLEFGDKERGDDYTIPVAPPELPPDDRGLYPEDACEADTWKRFHEYPEKMAKATAHLTGVPKKDPVPLYEKYAAAKRLRGKGFPQMVEQDPLPPSEDVELFLGDDGRPLGEKECVAHADFIREKHAAVLRLPEHHARLGLDESVIDVDRIEIAFVKQYKKLQKKGKTMPPGDRHLMEIEYDNLTVAQCCAMEHAKRTWAARGLGKVTRAADMVGKQVKVVRAFGGDRVKLREAAEREKAKMAAAAPVAAEAAAAKLLKRHWKKGDVAKSMSTKSFDDDRFDQPQFEQAPKPPKFRPPRAEINRGIYGFDVPEPPPVTEAELDALLRGEEVVEAAPEEVAKKPFNPFLVSH